MSPEQAGMGGVDVDTRSYIYSLGVLLYELLTGRTPFDHKTLVQSGMDEMRRTLLEVEPQRPSSRVAMLTDADLTTTSTNRHTEPPKLAALIRGDLDWIVMKALEKERARRYETANGLAEDIQRHLSNEPVLARPPSRIYRLQKLVRRNKVVFTAAAVVSVTLLAGFGTSTWLLVQEREARQRADAAELQQAKLAHEALLARGNEARLRHQAEAREKFTQAAILISDGRFDEADTMIGEDVPSEPSVEAAADLRSLGEWHALQGRWKQAADRLNSLRQVNQLDGWDQSSLDFLAIGVSLIESGNLDLYNQFCRAELARFASTTNPVVAERIVKTCLIKSPNPTIMEAAAPLANVAAKAFATVDTHDKSAVFRAAWESVSLALWEYRQRHYAQSADWAKRCLAYLDSNPAREAAAHVELAMALWQLSQKPEAIKELAIARQSINDNVNGTLEEGNVTHGFWFDWIFAKILSEEAQTSIHPGQR